MRDIALFLVIFGSIPFILKRPWIGILMWSWLSYMNPHRMTWTLAVDFPFAQVIAMVTIAAFIIHGGGRLPITVLSVSILTYTLWTCFTTVFALVPMWAYEKWETFMKIQVMTVLTLCLINSRERLQALVWVITLSLGFFALKGGVFTVLTAGEYRVWGPPNSFIADNNHLALALIIMLPYMRYLNQIAENRWVRRGFLALMVLALFAIVATYSRGGLLALGTMVLYLWVKSKRRALLAFGGVAALVALGFFMPEKWYDRMYSIGQYETDASAGGRFDAWTFAFKLANARPVTGGGFGVFGHQPTYQQYYPNASGPARAAHSVYFEVMGEHGWIGFFLFLTICATAFLSCSWVNFKTRRREDLRWLNELSRMTQVSLVGFGSGGAFINVAHYDLFWHILAIVVILRVLAERALRTEPAAAPVETSVRAPAPVPAGAAAAAALPAGARLGGQSGFLIERR